jgi:hypothetical protein
MIAIHIQLFEFMLELVRIDAKIQQRADEHITADTTENIEVKGFHFLIAFGLAAQKVKKHTGC